MPLTWIIVLVIFGAIFLLIIIFILLGFIQQQKIKIFKATKQKLLTEINDHRRLLIKKKLTPIKIQYQLPVGEQCYFLGQSNMYSKNAKHNFDVNFLHFERDFSQPYDFEIITLNGFLDLKPKWELNTYQGMLYVTNKRILLEGKNNVKTIWLEDILYTNIAILNLSEGYFKGVIVVIHNKIYKITNDDINLAIVLYWLVQKNRKGEQ